jgi:hypothetical protein
VFVWTPSTGTQPLAAYFASYGYDLSAYRITETHVSADGRTFGLSARLLADQTQRFGIVITVPAPGTVVLLASLLVLGRPRQH